MRIQISLLALFFIKYKLVPSVLFFYKLMLLMSIVSIILLSASILRRDFSILLSRAALVVLLLILSINYNSTHFLLLEKGLSLYNGLYQCNPNSHVFNMFLTILSFFILSLTSYYPRKAVVSVNDYTEADKPSEIISLPSHFGKAYQQIKNVDKTIVLANDYEEINKQIETIDKPMVPTNDYEKINEEIEIIDKTSTQFRLLEYSLIIIFVLCGAMFLMSANDIISIFISIELQSYGLYLLSSVYRNSELSTKAGLTYFLLGGLSSCIILLSQGLLYINSGSTNLENIYIISNISILNTEATTSVTDHLYNIEGLYNQFYINFSLIILSVGFLFKVSAAPFHFWSPDVYDGVPTLVTTFIAIIAKISIFIFLLELVHFTNNNANEMLNYNWSKNLLLSSLLSLVIGTVLGLTQSRIKRLYAYSTISHVGFILLALSINTTESVQAFIFYLIQYSISNLNAFIILVSVGYLYINYYNNSKEYSELKENNNSPVQLISQIKGLYKLNTMLALSFAITLFSFLGVPPLLGFFGKQMVLSASLDSGYIFMSLVAILTSVISAVYYLVVIKHIFFDDNNYTKITFSGKTKVETNYDTSISTYETSKALDIKGPNYVRLSSNLTATISTLTLVTAMFIFVPNESLNLVKILSLFILYV